MQWLHSWKIPTISCLVALLFLAFWPWEFFLTLLGFLYCFRLFALILEKISKKSNMTENDSGSTSHLDSNNNDPIINAIPDIEIALILISSIGVFFYVEFGSSFNWNILSGGVIGVIYFFCMNFLFNLIGWNLLFFATQILTGLGRFGPIDESGHNGFSHCDSPDIGCTVTHINNCD